MCVPLLFFVFRICRNMDEIRTLIRQLDESAFLNAIARFLDLHCDLLEQTKQDHTGHDDYDPLQAPTQCCDYLGGIGWKKVKHLARHANVPIVNHGVKGCSISLSGLNKIKEYMESEG